MQATAQASWSPLWAAPEVVRLEKGNVKADIWSLGLIIWVRGCLCACLLLADALHSRVQLPKTGQVSKLELRWMDLALSCL